MTHVTGRHYLVCWVLLVMGLPPLVPQSQDQPSFSVEVDVVQILASVRDSSGRLVSDLEKEAFVLEEEGRPQEIRYFSRETDLPLTLGLLVDSSMSQLAVLQEEREASYRFFKQILRPDKDLAFVISFDLDVELLQDFTSGLDLLQEGLEEIEVPGGRNDRRVGTVLYDAVFLAADEMLQEQTGRKAIILISDGVDFGSLVDKTEAIEAAQKADTLIFSIRYYDDKMYSGLRRRRGGMRRPSARREFPDGKKVLRELAEETGGQLFDVSNKTTLEEVFAQIEEELRSQYMIGYAPSKGDNTGGGFRRIELRTRDTSLEVQHRSGYYVRER
jgi:VWFA-related protein